jgi:hypothetical protein
MRITIEALDANSVQMLGYTPAPSYVVTFASSSFNGEARFVPASNDARSCIGQSFDVEVSQERVTELMAVTRDHPESVVALPKTCAFQVHGVVISIVPITEPAGTEIVTIEANGALFTLAGQDLDGMKLSLGKMVSFTAHDLSLWDEAL